MDPIKIGENVIEREFEAKNLGIVFDEELNWTRHVNLSIAKAYGKLKHARRFKNFLNESSKLKLIETYILSQLNYGDIILQNLTNLLQNKVQKLQNSCVRFTFGLRKYDHISGLLKSKNILNMNNRRMLHCLTLMYKIKMKKAPGYLCDRIISHEAHGHFTRNRLNINPPFARSKIRSMSFFIYISKKFNEIPSLINNSKLSISTFRSKCRKFLFDKQCL